MQRVTPDRAWPLYDVAAIRRIETDKSGDFTVELASGASLRGSRRYRPAD